MLNSTVINWIDLKLNHNVYILDTYYLFNTLNNTIINQIIKISFCILILNIFFYKVLQYYNYNVFMKKILNFFNLSTYIILTILSLCKLFNTIDLFNRLEGHLVDDINKYWFNTIVNINNQRLSYWDCLFYSNNLLGDSIIFLSFFIGFICLCILGFKSITYKIESIVLFIFFNLITTIMCSTNNLLIMFIMFEFLFLPTIYYVYILAYAKKSDKSINYLVLWTLFGSFLCAFGLTYIYAVSNTLNYQQLFIYKFSNFEKNFLFIIFFIGFGIKIPLTPFNNWLIKIHVEAPAGFSIFLSGFLVKSAFYCFYTFNHIFQTVENKWLLTIIICISIFESSLEMWNQTDIKKLIAWSTIQEMGLILMFFLNTNQQIYFLSIIFIVMHGILSAIMFLLIDIIYNETKTRNLINLQGLGVHFTEIKIYLWIQILMFLGFPLTVKFLIEWQVLTFLYSSNMFFIMITMLTLNIIGNLGFLKNMLLILYGIPPKKWITFYTLTTLQKNILQLLLIILVYIWFIIFFL